MSHCSRYGCKEPAVVAVIFPTLRAATYGCEKHRDLTWRTYQEARRIANDALVKMGFAPIETDQGPRWVELVEA